MAETAPSARVLKLGEWFFRQRSWTPILFILVLIACTFKESPDIFTWVPGLILLALGEGMRLWGVAVIGKESRTRGSGVARLVSSGPYAYLRNPLYLGNLFLTLAAVCLSELLWFLPIAILLFVVQYVPIVLWEESILAARFEAAYAAYCRQVPRWVPRWRPAAAAAGPAVPYQWCDAFWSERSTLTTLAFLLLFMIAKEDLRHIPKYVHKRFAHAPKTSGVLVR